MHPVEMDTVDAIPLLIGPDLGLRHIGVDVAEIGEDVAEHLDARLLGPAHQFLERRVRLHTWPAVGVEDDVTDLRGGSDHPLPLGTGIEVSGHD
jgi:hypothetical protein